jgi:hypothetical protein
MSESLSQKYERILSMCEVGKRKGAFTQIACPNTGNHKHGDKEKSASLGLHSNGISFKCFAGCQTDDFLKSLGLTFKDLFPDNEETPSNIYTYHNQDGTYHHDKVKYKLPNGKKTFKQRTINEDGSIDYKATVGVPFRYPQLIEAIKQDKVIIFAEGEKDAMTAKILGYESTTMGGASDWKDEYKNFFKGANLVLIPDKDDPGLKLTSSMIDSLKTVTKSLKTMILPLGKDLTEWVEAGNFDLKSLIDKTAIELITLEGVPEPVVKVIVGGYELYWIGLNLKVIIDHIENDDSVEIAVYQNGRPIHISGYKLLSISHKDGLVRSLERLNNKLNWRVIVNQITVQCLSRIRAGEDVVLLTSEFGKNKPEYLVNPLFVQNNANIIYADRGSAKSLFVTMIGLILTMGAGGDIFGLGVEKPWTILFLDWENDQYTTGWQKACLARGLDMEDTDFHYLHCSSPLFKCLHHVQSKINEVSADVVIIDSLAVATGGNLNDSEPALNFYNALRQLPVTPIIIAHTAKDKENKHRTVYGNAFYENLARSIWEVSKFQQLGSSELTLSLYQRKSPPFSGNQMPKGLKFKFDGDRIYVNPCSPMDDERQGN